MSERGILWRIKPPPATHHDDSCERMAWSVKRTFLAVLSNRRFTEEILKTRFCLVELTLKIRQLTSVSSDPTKLDAITPYHFLL